MNSTVVPERSLPAQIPVHAIAGDFGRAPAPEMYDQEPEEVNVQLKDVFAMLMRHRLLLVSAVVLSLAATAYLAWREIPQYRASASLRLRDQRAAMTEGIGDAAIQQAMGKTNDPILSELQVLASRGVAGEVVDRENLRLRVIDGGVPRASLAQLAIAPNATTGMLELGFQPRSYTVKGAAGEATARYGERVRVGGVSFAVMRRPAEAKAKVVVSSRNAAVDHLLNHLQAVPREKTDVVDLAYTDPDPEVAAAVTNTTANVFRSLNIRNAQDQSRRRREFVAEQLHQADSVLMKAQLALADFRRRQQVFSSREKLQAQSTGLLQLDQRRGELDADRRVYQSLLDGLLRDRARGASGGSSVRALVASPGIAANPVVTQLFAQLVRYESARDSLTAGEFGSTRTNPDVQRLSTLIAGTESSLVEAVRSQIVALDARIASVDALKVQGAGDLQGLPGVEAEEVRLVQQVETVAHLADQLREEHQKARIAEAVEAGQVEIVDTAFPPGDPVPQNRGMKLLLGLLLGVVLGSGGALLLEHLNTSVRGKEDLEQLLRLPGLALIPRIQGLSADKRLRLKAGAAPAEPADGPSLELVTSTDARSPAAEAFRALRTNLIFSQAVHSLRTLVVTSASPAEGKTLTAGNLAAAFAQQGMRVLVVDCDLRRPRVHELFGTTREPGLTELVLGLRVAADVVRSTPVPGLDVLPSGTLPPNPTELLGGERMKATVEALKKDYDLLVLDTAPVTAAADAAVMGARTDAVLMVVRAGHSDRAVVQHAVQQLRNVGARVVGAVLNDPDAKVPQYGGGYYYYSEYSSSTR
ncbi:MAG TPA: polysaccharide biosynthesis tyrosine autokinase [Longimicrobium sp.]|nr:polysaccharide biosynthesis tyrosine autokinase [Longimicrobium sp.]